MEEIHKGSVQSNSAPRYDLLGSSRAESTMSSGRRSWIGGPASGRVSVPSINRNLYIIAEEHGVSSVRPCALCSCERAVFQQAGMSSGAGHWYV